MTSPHRIVNPGSLVAPRGFAHAVVAAAGRTIYLGGQVADDPNGTIAGTLLEQFDGAASNLVTALAAAGGAPEHLVSLHIYVTDVRQYRAAGKELGIAYRRHFGRHYPALALFGVSELFEPDAKIELVGVAVVPTGDHL